MLRLFVEAYDTGDAPLKTFILRSIKHHVEQAHQPAVALHQDELMMRVLTHSASFLVARAVAGIGEERMQATMEACEAGGEWWAAAQLWFATSSLRGQVRPLLVSMQTGVPVHTGSCPLTVCLWRDSEPGQS